MAEAERYKFPLEERIFLLTHYYKLHAGFETLLAMFMQQFIFPARSSDLTLMDFCIWGLVKDRVFAHDLQTIDDLKKAISVEFDFITRDKALLRRMVDANQSRYLKCIDQEGKHFEHLL